MKFIADLKAKASAHKTVSRIIGVLLLAGLCVGGFFGWQQYQYMQTGQYALEKIKKALEPPDPQALANMVDFNSIIRDLYEPCKTVFPFLMENPDKARRVMNSWQMSLLKNFLDKDGSAKQVQEETEEEKLTKPLRILPDDFVGQILSTVRYQEQRPDRGLVSVKIDNPMLKRDFTLVMSMDKTPDGWKIKHIVNARELIIQLREAMLQRYKAYYDVYLNKNANTKKIMDQQLPIQSCTANAGLLSDNKTLLLVVRVIARNAGSAQANNFNIDTSILNGSGNVLVHRYLNAAKPVAPGEDFDHSWTFELEYNSPLGRSILAAGPLQCKVSWRTLSLADARVLHIQELPYVDAACDKPGHNHPQGFCLLPVFQH